MTLSRFELLLFTTCFGATFTILCMTSPVERSVAGLVIYAIFRPFFFILFIANLARIIKDSWNTFKD